jgi:hypothetical protein
MTEYVKAESSTWGEDSRPKSVYQKVQMQLKETILQYYPVVDHYKI